MSIKYCPQCQKLTETKVIATGYKQVRVNGGVVKMRKINHSIEDAGCGYSWDTFEIPENIIRRIAPNLFNA